MDVIPTLWRLLEKFHPRVYGLTGFIAVMEALKLVPAAVLALMIDAISSFTPEKVPLILILIGVLFIASALVSLIDVRLEYESANLGFDCEVDLLMKSSRKLLGLPLGYHELHNTGSVVHTLHRGSDRLVELIYFGGRELLPTVFQLVVTLSALLIIGWIPGLVFFAFIPVFGLLIHWYGVTVQPLRHGYHKKLDEAAGLIGERIINVRTVQDFAVEERELKSYGSLLDEYIGLQRKRMRFQKNYFAVRDMALNIARAVIMGTGVWLVVRGRMTAGMLVFFITLTERANLSLFRMASMYNRASDSFEAIRRLIRILEEKETIIERPDARTADGIQGRIAFNKVSFAYVPHQEVLKDISFEIAPKKMVAVIGRSGAGKSTIVKLLYRHFDATRGAITVDGTDIRDFRLESYRRRIASVPQEVEVFNSTIRDNIAFGKFDAEDAEIISASKTAFADDFIRQLPDGYETLVGERGVRLSGGQRQRIGIARALLSKPAILVFDEATSSLDTQSEQLIQQAMLSLSNQFTMIVIAHRLSTIEHSDLVLVMEEGKIIEAGTHEDLIARKGVYRHMRSLQRLGDVRS